MKKQLLRSALISLSVSLGATAGLPQSDQADKESRKLRDSHYVSVGSRAGGPERVCQLFFLTGDVRAPLERFRDYTRAIESAGLARVQLVAPLLKTLPGTDRYAEELF